MSPSRREVLAATVVTAAWAITGMSFDAPIRRVRAGGRVELHCPGATHFRLRLAGRTRLVAAPNGRAVFGAPFHIGRREWTRLRCTPLVDGDTAGASVDFDVLTTPPVFGV